MSLTSYQTAPPRVTVPARYGCGRLPARRRGQNGFTHRNQVVCCRPVFARRPWTAGSRPQVRPGGHLQTGRRQASEQTGQPANRPVLARPGSDLLSHALRRSTIGAEGLHGRVRDGIGCFPLAITTRPCKHRTAARGSPPGSLSRLPVFVRVRTRTFLPPRRQTGSWRDRAHGGPAPRTDPGPAAGRRMESRFAPPPAHRVVPGSVVRAAYASEMQRFPLHVRFSAPAGMRPEKEQADRAISTG